jgi:hypothetical protein
MQILFIIFTLLLFFTGCNIKHPPKEIDLDTIYDTIPAFDINNTPPYKSAFNTVLNKTFYLFPDGNTTDSLKNLATENFYL